MYCASDAAQLACESFHSMVRWVVGGAWRIGSSYLRPELPNGLGFRDRAFEQRHLHVFNYRDHSTENGSHMTHTLLLSLAALRQTHPVRFLLKVSPKIHWFRGPSRMSSS